MISPASACEEVGPSSKITTTLHKHSVACKHCSMYTYVDDSSSKASDGVYGCGQQPSTQCGKHNKEVNEVHTAHYTNIQYLTPLLQIHCCLLDHARECIIFTVDHNIPLERSPNLVVWLIFTSSGGSKVKIACLQLHLMQLNLSQC